MAGIAAEMSTSSGVPARKADRKLVNIGAGLRQRGLNKVTVNLLDLSTHGFRIETFIGLSPGDDVWLTLPGLQGTQARVAWVRDFHAGFEFVSPLHPAVLEMIVQRSRS